MAMTISEYLIHRDIKAAQFAIMLQTSKASVSKWINGTSVPNAAMLAKIHEVTDGDVTPNDFFDFTRSEVAE